MIRFLRWAVLYAGLLVALLIHAGKPSDDGGGARIAFEYQQF